MINKSQLIRLVVFLMMVLAVMLFIAWLLAPALIPDP